MRREENSGTLLSTRLVYFTKLFIFNTVANGTPRATPGSVPAKTSAGAIKRSNMQLQEMKKLLLAKKHELSSRQVSQADIAIEKNAEVLDEIQRNADRNLALHSLTQIWETASLVSEALKRIEDGSYGTCTECDDPISERRLRAIPWAKYCIHCQEIADRTAVDESWPEAA